jgi:hypothetical protein
VAALITMGVREATLEKLSYVGGCVESAEPVPLISDRQEKQHTAIA